MSSPAPTAASAAGCTASSSGPSSRQYRKARAWRPAGSGDPRERIEREEKSRIHHRGPARQSRNRNSEYLPQRRKGRKVRRLRVKIIYQSFCPFPVTLAPLRLGGRNSRLRVLSMPDYLRRPRKFLTIVIRRDRPTFILHDETVSQCHPEAIAEGSRLRRW